MMKEINIEMKILFFILNVFRKCVDWCSEKAFSWFYRGKQEFVPPIKNPCLQEPAHVLAAKIRRRELKSVDLVKAFIHRIKEVQPIVNAIVDERFSEAVEEARLVDEFLNTTSKSEREIYEESPLLGVPITIKEAIAVKGCLFTVGLPARRGLRAEADADAVSLLRKAGAIPIAVTITSELCLWWESYNALYGRCRNPYDTTRTSGGSSGGEGCVLGCGGSVIGLGNDVGGSIRIPAAFNGVFGHKPTRGMVSNGGQYPDFDPDLQAYLMTGPMCRYASDLLPLMKVLSVNHRNMLDTKVNLEKLKFYYMENEGGNPLVSSVNPEIISAQKKVLDYFRERYGITPVKVDIPNMSRSFEIWAAIIVSSGLRPTDEAMTGRNGRANLFAELVRWAVGLHNHHILPVLCSAIMSKTLISKSRTQNMLYSKMACDLERHFERMLGNDGVFLFPASPDVAPYHGQAMLKPFSVSYTAVFNLLGLPVSQCPVGLSDSSGLPIGLQVVGGHYSDHVTIAVAEEIERVFGGWMPPWGVAP